MSTIKLGRLCVSIRQGLAMGSIALLPFSIQFAHAGDQQESHIETIEVTATALKVETPAKETPKSVSIISQEELNKRSPQKLDEALRYTSGVTAQPYGSDNDTDWFKVRGFDATTYLNGNRLFRDGYYTWLLEPYGLERVEVIKGPSAILFGESAPGGVVNAVQKKPTYAPQGELKVEVGNNNHKAVAFDISDSANDDNTMRYRLVGAFKKADGELDHTENERYYLAPSLEIDISDSTALTLFATYLQDDGIPTNPFFPVSGTLTDSDYGTIKPTTNLGQPDYDKYQRTQLSLGYLLEHDINDVWTFNQNLNYGYNELYLRSSYSFPNSVASADTLYQGLVFRDGKNQSITFDNNFVGSWYSNDAEHTVLLGIDLQHHKTDGDEQDDYGFGSISLIDLEYGNYTPIDPANNIKREISKSQASLYSQYQLKLQDQWIANVGARYDWVETENKGKSTTLDQNKSRDDSQLSLNAGVMYLSEFGLSPYANYSQSFEVISTIDSTTNELYKPLEGEQVEIGIKYEPSFIDGFVNLAWFDITQKNALVTDSTTYVATQTGKLTSTGVELEGVANITDEVKVRASYTYTDAKTDESYGQGMQQAALIPEHQVSAWVDYDAYALLQGLNIGTGVRYVGESKDNPKSSDLTVPSATLWDAAVTYDISKEWQAQLNVNNIFDKEYIAGCDYWCYYGQSRSVMLTANYRW